MADNLKFTPQNSEHINFHNAVTSKTLIALWSESRKTFCPTKSEGTGSKILHMIKFSFLLFFTLEQFLSWAKINLCDHL